MSVARVTSKQSLNGFVIADFTMEKIIYTGDTRTLKDVCSHCKMCELVCSFSHYGQVNPRRSRIRLVHTDLDEAMPVTCLQCEDAPCVRLCPAGAIVRRKDEYLAVDESRCIGCGICVIACPVGAISIDSATGLASKCDLCDDDPQCVKYCPANVLRKGKATDLALLKSRRFAKDLSEVNREESRTD